MDAVKENAFLVFNSEFAKAGLGNAPEGLVQLLKNYACERNPCGKSAEESRKKIYKRIWGILWFGNSVGQGAFSGSKNPTYVYPSSLKTVIRSIIQGELANNDDPTGTRVYKVTLQDLHTAKWPAKKK